MNNPNTFALGWAAFAGCFLTGAGIGYFRAVEGRRIRAVDNIQQTKDREALLDKLDAKWREEGKLKPRVVVAVTDAAPPHPRKQQKAAMEKDKEKD